MRNFIITFLDQDRATELESIPVSFNTLEEATDYAYEYSENKYKYFNLKETA